MPPDLNITSLRTVIDTISRRRWRCALLDMDRSNIHQCWEWGEIIACRPHHSVSRIAFEQDDRIVAMAQVIIKGAAWARLGLADVEWGALFRRDLMSSPTVIQTCIRNIVSEYGTRRGLHVRFRPPFRPDEDDSYALAASMSMMNFKRQENSRPYRTSVIDLQQTLDEIRAGFHRKWRNHLKAAEKFDLHVEHGTSDSMFERFRVIYEAMWRAKRFASGVRVAEIQRLHHALSPKDRFWIFIACDGKQDFGASVCTCWGDTMTYFLGATDPDVRRDACPGYLLQWTQLKAAREIGCRWYETGGIDEVKTPDIAQFKSRMGGKIVSAPGQYEAAPRFRHRLLERVRAAIAQRHAKQLE